MKPQGGFAVRAALVVAALACASGCRKKDANASVEAKAPAVRAVVKTATVDSRPMPRALPLTGTLQADVRTELTANASGRVVKTFVERGQKVTRGTAIAQLDIRAAAASAAEANANLESAKTQLEASRIECSRYDALVARGAITQQEYAKQTAKCKQDQAALGVSEARVASASLTVGDGTVRAPFTGVVTERAVSVGDYVQASSKVATLVVGDPLRLLLTVPERRFSDVKIGSLVRFAAAALPGRTFEGHIEHISGEVRSATRDVVVEAEVPNADGALLPGMFVDVDVVTGEVPMPVVPKSAVFDVGADKSLYVVESGQLVRRIVKPGVASGDLLAIEEGVTKGDVVVVDPSPSLEGGQLVQ
ncbi:putative Co/Zn/Cd efflux system membrane fusion protein [Labilithrix luteola]|uniref:Putative Co/Zn/Cd efflux system membrane fusion protein n=1 Tax=Labilithrix luteola TaxID=1391654 RepID=A0A0K1Q481_9BACT|nr:efflux RND transporter periplasmic adaptor subunit [Labilithrix luteola]AKV00452.1 putative Co/Zn/Cd efflux system membrane fusion protein [Labilithrix luteola]